MIGWFLSRRSQARTERTAEDATKALKDRVKQGEAAAGRAEQALETAREHAESASRSASAVEAIATALSPAQLTVEWLSRDGFVLRNTSTSPVEIESFSDPEAFVQDPFEVPVTLAPGYSVTGYILDVMGSTVPGELMLGVTGEPSPVVVPLSGRPGRD